MQNQIVFMRWFLGLNRDYLRLKLLLREPPEVRGLLLRGLLLRGLLVRGLGLLRGVL